MTKRDGPRLPVRQLAILAVARFAEPLAMTSVFPYLPAMVESFGVEEHDVGLWVGVTSAVFSLAQSVTAVPWGRASDRYGRKPVILIGLLCTMACFLVWGVSSSLPMAVVVRAIMGGSNGNVGIIRTMVAEMVPERELQPRAFSLMPLVWSIGSIFGPAFGGFFAQPAKRFPSLFGKSRFFNKYPFALPNLLGAIIFLISVSTGFLFLKETLASKKHSRDLGLILGGKMTSCCKKRKTHQRYSSIQDEEAAATLLHANGHQPKLSTPTSGRERKRAPPSMKTVFTRQSVINLVAYTFLAFHSVAYDQVMSVFLSFKPDRNTPMDVHLPFIFNGGFGLDTSQIGTIFTLYGIVCGGVQFLLFPPICSYFGTLTCFRACCIAFPFIYLMTPFTVLIEDSQKRYAALMIVMVLKSFAVIVGFPCTTILLTNSATSLRVLGTLNGFATTFSALGRAAGPAVAGMAFSWGVKHAMVSAPWWVLAAFSVFGAVPAYMIVEGPGPSSDSSDDDSDEEQPADEETEYEIDDDLEEPDAPLSRPRAVVFTDGDDELDPAADDVRIPDPAAQDDLPLVGSLKSSSPIADPGSMKRQELHTT